MGCGCSTFLTVQNIFQRNLYSLMRMLRELTSEWYVITKVTPFIFLLFLLVSPTLNLTFLISESLCLQTMTSFSLCFAQNHSQNKILWVLTRKEVSFKIVHENRSIRWTTYSPNHSWRIVLLFDYQIRYNCF